MVLLADLVVRLPVAEIDAMDHAFALHRRDGAKHARVICRTQRSAHHLVQLIDGPSVARLAPEHVANGVGDGAGAGHAEDHKPLTHLSCASRLCNTDAAPEAQQIRRGGEERLGRRRRSRAHCRDRRVHRGLDQPPSRLPQRGRGRELLGQHRRPARRLEGQRSEHRHRPQRRPPRVREQHQRCPRLCGGGPRHPQRRRLRRLGEEAARRQLEQPPPGAERGRPAGQEGRGQPPLLYDPQYVITVTNAITAAYRSLDNGDAALFDRQRAAFGGALEPYFVRIADIRDKYAGIPIGSTESIFYYMAAILGLDLISPLEFMDAVAEGNDPPAPAVVEFQNQVTNHNIKVLVYNNQTVTAVTTNVKRLALANKIPQVGVSETLQPLTATFQDWQLSQLAMLEAALGTTP